MSHITYDELAQLLGGATPTSIQCVYTGTSPTNDHTCEEFDMCEKDEATHVSVYLRLDIGEVVPVRDFPIAHKQYEVAQVHARNAVTKICMLLGTLPVEPNGALHDSN